LSFLSISQDPICGNGQWSVAFWQCIVHHYNKHKLAEGIKWLAHSLKTKWGAIKHDITKLLGAIILYLLQTNLGFPWRMFLQKFWSFTSLRTQRILHFYFYTIDFCWRRCLNGQIPWRQRRHPPPTPPRKIPNHDSTSIEMEKFAW
jgi:hypothetical protein